MRGVTKGYSPIHFEISARTTAVLLIAFGMVLSSACRKTSESGTKVTIQLERPPQVYRVGRETIVLKLNDALGQPVSGAHLSLEGNMSHAGMAPTFGSASEIAPGSYRGNVDFSMAGDWIITVRARLSDGQQFERQFEVKGVRPD